MVLPNFEARSDRPVSISILSYMAEPLSMRLESHRSAQSRASLKMVRAHS